VVQAYLKAISGALVAGLSVLAATSGGWNAHDYVAAAIAFLAGLGIVAAVPNTPKPGAKK